MITENSKTNEPHKFVINLLQKIRLDLRSLNKSFPLQKLPICYTYKSIRQQYKNDKLKKLAPTWKYKFGLPNGSYSVLDIEDYIEYILKKRETLSTAPPIHIYINRINNRLVFKKRRI